MNLPPGVRLHSPDLGPLYADGWALRSAAGLLALDAPVVNVSKRKKADESPSLFSSLEG